jgi:hypothetical protein
VPLPFTFLLALGGTVVAYLLLAESVKRWLYRRLPPRAPVIRPPFPLIGRQ